MTDLPAPLETPPRGPLQAARLAFRAFASFGGRATRAEFWYFVLFLFLASLVLTIVNSLVFGPERSVTLTTTLAPDGTASTVRSVKTLYTSGWPGTLFKVATLIPFLALAARRLHDSGRTALWILLPVALGTVVLGTTFVLLWPSSQGEMTPDATQALARWVNDHRGLLLAGPLAVFLSGVWVTTLLARGSDPGPNRFGPPRFGPPPLRIAPLRPGAPPAA